MRGIGGSRFDPGAARSEVARSGPIELGWSENTGRHRHALFARKSASTWTNEVLYIERLLFTFVIDLPFGPNW